MKRDTSQARAKLNAIRASLDKAIAAVASEHGITLSTGKCKFDDYAGNFTFAIEGQFAGGVSKEGQMYNVIKGFTPGLPDLGASLRYKDKILTITGANTTGTKVLAKHQDGKTYLWATDAIVKIAAMPDNAIPVTEVVG